MAYVNRRYDISALVITSVDVDEEEDKARVSDTRLVKRPVARTSGYSLSSLDTLEVDEPLRVVSAQNSRDTISVYVGDDVDSSYIITIEDFKVMAYVHWIPDVFFWGTARTFMDSANASSVVSGELEADSGVNYQVSADVIVTFDDSVQAWCHTGIGAGNTTGRAYIICEPGLNVYGSVDVDSFVGCSVDSQVNYLSGAGFDCFGEISGVTCIVGDGASISISSGELTAICHITRQSYSECHCTASSVVYSVSDNVGRGEVNVLSSVDTLGDCVMPSGGTVIVRADNRCDVMSVMNVDGVIAGESVVGAFGNNDVSCGVNIHGEATKIEALGITGDGATTTVTLGDIVTVDSSVVSHPSVDVTCYAAIHSSVNRQVFNSCDIDGHSDVECVPYIPEVPVLKGFGTCDVDVQVIRLNAGDMNAHSTVVTVPTSVTYGTCDIIFSADVECDASSLTRLRCDIHATGAIISAASSHSYGWDTHVNSAEVVADPNFEYKIEEIDPITCLAECEASPLRVMFFSADVEAGGLSIVASGITGDGAALIISSPEVVAGAGVTFVVGARLNGLCDSIATCINEISDIVTIDVESTLQGTAYKEVNAEISVDVAAATITAASSHATGAGVYITEGQIEARSINIQMSDAECVMSCVIETWPVTNANCDHYGVDYAAVTVLSMGVTVSGGRAVLTALPET